MMKTLLLVLCVVLGCSSSSSDSSNSTGGQTGDACPNLSGNWTVAQHCDASLVGLSAVATQSQCTLSFASPFEGFKATVGSDGSVSVSGPQTCSGSSNATSITLSCAPPNCAVLLDR